MTGYLEDVRGGKTMSKKEKAQTHFDLARRIIQSWPEWKKKIVCTPVKYSKLLKARKEVEV